MKALAVDLGGTHVAYGVVEDRRLVFHERFDVVSATSLRSVLDAIEDVLRQCQGTHGECAGLAMGFPCIVDTSENRVLSVLKKYEDAIDIDLSEWCRSRLGLDLRIENDARMALLGEQYAGAGRDEEDLVMMTLGTGDWNGCAHPRPAVARQSLPRSVSRRPSHGEHRWQVLSLRKCGLRGV